MNKYLDLAKELKEMWNMRKMMIPIVELEKKTWMSGNQQENRDLSSTGFYRSSWP